MYASKCNMSPNNLIFFNSTLYRPLYYFTLIKKDQMPARIKSINYYNYPKIFDAAFSVVKMFLKEKIKKRVIETIIIIKI